MKFFALVCALAFVVWVLASYQKADTYRTEIVGPVVHERMTPTKRDIDLAHPPSGYLAPHWKPGEPTIDPGDIESSQVRSLARESWFKKLLWRLRCAIFSCGSKPQAEAPKPPVPTSVNEGVNFQGIPSTSFIVPDPVGDIGPGYYVQAVNSAFQIFNRTGEPATDALYINVLWTGVNSPCSEGNPIDPVVRYDKVAERWLISGFVSPSSDYMCIAVSQSADPVSGGWFLYEFKAVDPITNVRFFD